MAQLMQIQLQRFDAQPWGFRLQGGTDFAAPLVVQKINSGSLAEQAGLLPGDAVIKINDVDVYNLRHKDAQDLVVRSGNNFIVTVQRGGMTWRPSVTPTGQLPSPNPHSPYGQTVTKTSLAHKQQEVHHIGSGYNNSARPFNSVNGNDGQVKSIVNKQYNTPVGIYSDETIAETLSAQAEVLAGGVLGINFKKNEKQYSGDKSEVLKFLQEEETGEHEPEPRSPANFYWTHSHAIGGQRPSRPVTPASSKPHDERIGTPLQQNTLAPSASHRPSLPSHHPESRRGDAAEEKPPSTTTPTIDPRLIIAPVCPALQSPEYKAELEAAAIAAGVAPREQKPLTNLPQCAICGVGIVGVFVRIKDKNLHVECFKCATCGTSLKNQGYYNFNNKLYCDIHARLAASQNPPSGTEGYVPVPIKPNTKLSASTISAALNNIGYNGSPTNGTSTPLYSAPPSNVNQGFARPYGAPAPAPAAAPKSPTSYPPPQVANQAGCNNNNNNNNWNQPRQIPVQHQQHQQQPASNMYATLPRSNAGPQEYEQHQYYECEGHRRVEEHRAASYFEEDTEIIEANRESRNSFAWPPPRDDSRPTPTAAPLYIAPPETQHVVPKPIQQKQVCQHEEETRLQQEHEEQQQMQWQSRSAPQLTGLRGGMNAPEIESSSDSYTSTCTTTTTTSEEYQRMYNAQVQAYQMQGYDQSGSELDYHMDMEVAAMQQQNEQCYLSSSECLSGRRSAQECVESLAGTLSTFRLVDMVREVTPSPIPPPKAPRHVEFNDEPQMEPDRKAKEPPKKEVPPKKEEEPQKPPKTVEPLTQQKSVEEPICVKETYKVCGEETKSEEEKLVVEDRSEILQSQRIFQPTPEIKIEIPPVKPIPPTNIPNPCPKEWISPMVRALTTAPDTPVHMVECLCPKPCDFTCQCNPETIEKEKQEDCQRKKEAERLAAIKPEPKPAPEPEPEPVFLRESPPKGSNITNAMTTAPDFKLQFAPNPNNEIPLPEESEPYLPPPIDMTPYEREDRRPKSPFLKALTTAPDTPYNPFGHDVCSQLLDLPTPTEKLSMVDALITAPDRPYTPLNPEKATLIIEEQKKAEEKKPYQFQVLSNDDTCEFSATKTEQRQTSAFANMTNVASSFQPSRDPLPPGAHRSSIVPPQQQSEYESQRRASQRNVSQMSSSTCCATSSSKSVQQQYQQQQQTKSTSLLSTSTSSAISKADLNVIAHEIDEMFEDTRVPFPPPSPLSHLKARASPSGLHKPDTIPQYQRNWTVLPTQRPCRTPEPHELRENVPLAFVETPASPTPAVPPTHARLSPSGLHHPDSIPTYQSHRKVLPEPAVLRENVPLAFVHSRSPTPNPEAVSSSTCCKGTCLNAQQQQKQQHQVHQQQQQQQSTIQQSSIKSSHTAASSSSTASRTMTRVSEQKQQQQYLTPTPTVPIIVEDRSGPVTMAFQSLDEHQPHDESYPPSRPYTPSLINKPAPIIPFYQTPEKLCFEECPATTGHVFDRRSVSPCPDRAKSPAPGPPPNPLSAIRAPRLRDSDLPTASPRTLQVGSITTGQSYLGAQQMQQQQQQQGQVLSHYQTASQSGSHSYVEKPEVVQQRQVGDLTIQKREKESRLAEEKKSQLESKTTSQVGNTQIERRRKVVEEYEHTQKAKTIEIRTGSSSSTTTSTTGGAITGADVRSSYGKTGFVANQARRLSGLEQEITNLTSQSQAISARAATLTETTFPQLSSPEPVSKFPIKTVLSPHYEPEPQKYVVSSSSSNKLVGPPPGFKQQQLSSSTQSSVSQKQQQQQTHSAQSSSSLAAVSSSCTLTNASATNQQQQSRPSAIPVPAYKPPPAPTHHAHHPQQPSAGGVGAAAGRCPVTGKVCSGAGSGAGSNVCRAPCSQSMQSQPSSNNNTYKPTASTGPAGFKPPQASQAPPQQMQSQQQPKQPLFKPNIPAVNVSNSPTSSFAPPPPTPSTQPAPGSGPSSNIGGKGKAFGATSAPKRGRGILNKAVESGVRVPLCSSCNMQIRGPFITALGRIWCPDHFMCVNANCRRPLQDVGFVEEKGDLYCEYCFEKYLAPTCSKCSGKIKGDCLNAIGRHFHPECFTCAHCGKLFGNTPFFLEEGMAYCEADWNELFTTKCFACGFPVEAGDRWVEALGNNYHSQCFNCTYCKKNLEGQSFYNKGGRPFCKNHAR
ncbi:PDZ and LIM domain protein Zasp isoform X4 [Episyrphus balteatus]|uniref:PDZ and LIM domain protein Zasp isoform X4 n=1 Tax=Episyrphus balteatus TaxID=286459 RepID=UPI002484E5C4|nr:PDZ and LIM domain protein Zasp isoform X4 [Episyrphus balteatus]